jgi:glucuronate isomerase
MAFIRDDFLLQQEAGKRLYRKYAAEQPILDYHGHLSAKDIAEDRRFQNLFEIWLEGDHYKWRAMRANGVGERYCTGDAEPYDKFLAWARTVPSALRNPLYHWTHLELARYFGIEQLLDEETAPVIWSLANEQLSNGDLTARGILKRFGVVALCTTDDPTDSLADHEQIQASGCGTQVLPAFRPDRAIQTEDAAVFNAWVEKLSASVNLEIARLADFLSALEKRHDYFHAHGCRLSDHGLEYCFAEACSEAEASHIFEQLRRGNAVSALESAKFASFVMLFFGRMDAQKGWTKQLHLGAQRNTNTRMFQLLGRDGGFDSIGDWPQSSRLIGYMDRLARENALPKMILYNLNPADNYILATLIGNFQDGSLAGKIQLGSAWWFLDQKEGIERQLNALSNCGLLSRFVGMLTDSRSFMSFPRHEYFRRILCNLLGGEMEAGLLPNDEAMIGAMVRDICFQNAVKYFAFPSVQIAAETPVGASTR